MPADTAASCSSMWSTAVFPAGTVNGTTTVADFPGSSFTLVVPALAAAALSGTNHCPPIHSRWLSVQKTAGRLPTFYLKQLVQEAVRHVPGVQQVRNLIDVVSADGVSSVRC